MSAETLLSVRDLKVNFHSGDAVLPAVKGVSFDIRRGETVALVGESGSGKSVTALSILRLLPYPQASHPAGEVLFKGLDLMRAGQQQLRGVRGNSIAMIFQEPMSSLNPLHRVERQIGEVLTLHRGLSRAAARTRSIELLGEVGIDIQYFNCFGHGFVLSGMRGVTLLPEELCRPKEQTRSHFPSHHVGPLIYQQREIAV